MSADPRIHDHRLAVGEIGHQAKVVDAGESALEVRAGAPQQPGVRGFGRHPVAVPAAIDRDIGAQPQLARAIVTGEGETRGAEAGHCRRRHGRCARGGPGRGATAGGGHGRVAPWPTAGLASERALERFDTLLLLLDPFQERGTAGRGITLGKRRGRQQQGGRHQGGDEGHRRSVVNARPPCAPRDARKGAVRKSVGGR